MELNKNNYMKKLCWTLGLILSMGVHAVSKEQEKAAFSVQLLQAAGTGNNYHLLQASLEAGISPNFRGCDCKSDSLLHRACNHGHENEVALLLSYRANPNLLSSNLHSALDLARDRTHKIDAVARRITKMIRDAGGRSYGELAAALCNKKINI